MRCQKQGTGKGTRILASAVVAPLLCVGLMPAPALAYAAGTDELANKESMSAIEGVSVEGVEPNGTSQAIAPPDGSLTTGGSASNGAEMDGPVGTDTFGEADPESSLDAKAREVASQIRMEAGEDAPSVRLVEVLYARLGRGPIDPAISEEGQDFWTQALAALTGEPSTARGFWGAFEAVVRQWGIDCRTVEGADGSRWSMVLVDGAWYHVDVASAAAEFAARNDVQNGEPSRKWLLVGDATIASLCSAHSPWKAADGQDDELPAAQSDWAEDDGPGSSASDPDGDGDARVAASTSADVVGLSAQGETKDLSAAKVEAIANQAYTGKEITPQPKVTLEGKTLQLGKDYTIAYAENVNPGKAMLTITGVGSYAGTCSSSFAIMAPSVSYRVHVQTYGDQEAKNDGGVAGTSGESKRLEGIWIGLGSDFPVAGGITYRTHVQTYGWQDWKSDGQMAGTTGESKRLEAIEIKLTGDMEQAYDVYYRTHAQRIGWLAWAKNGETAGTSGLSYRLEAIQIVMIPKGEAAPNDVAGVSSGVSFSHMGNPGITYHSHVQTYGWQDWVNDGEMSGTTGESKRLEGFEAKLATSANGGIQYRTHVQTYGWQDWKSDGEMSGTEGESKRLEALQIQLTGDLANHFDVWYRTHVQTFGWLGWTKNGEPAGTEGLSRRMETMQVCILPKGSDAPGSTANAFLDKDPTLSGDPELDAMIGQFIGQTGTGYEGLRRAYEIISSYLYSQGNRWPGPNWEEWSIPYAKEMYLNHTGNCYRYASLMCWTARRLGYDAKVVPGWIPGRVNPHCDHGWVEVFLDGQVYVIDAEMNGNDGYPEYNWFMIKYADAYLRYYDLNDNRILR